jgi:UDP-glucose 4-epimerase
MVPGKGPLTVTGKTLITGAAGFIGSHLSERVRAAGGELLLIDDLSSGQMPNIAHLLDDRCRFVHDRVGRALEADPSLFDGVGRVFHLAAAVGVRRAIDDPLGTIHTNVTETDAVLEHAARAGAAVLVTSSSEVYGKPIQIPMREDQDLVFGATDSPRWSYALSKALDEQLALAYHHQRDLPVVMVRLFNIIGPRQSGKHGMVVPRMVQSAVAGRDLTIHGDGSQRRTFCDVRDAVAAMTALLDDPAHHGRVYNLGSDAEISIDRLADLVIEMAGGDAGKRFVPYDQAFARPVDDPPRRVPDLTRLRAAIDFRPLYTLRRTLGELIDAARSPEPSPAVTETT